MLFAGNASSASAGVHLIRCKAQREQAQKKERYKTKEKDRYRKR